MVQIELRIVPIKVFMIDSAIKSTNGFLPNATPKTILQKKLSIR